MVDLPAPERPTRPTFSRPAMETEILQHPLAVGIAEADIDEGDRAAEADREAWHPGHRLHLMGQPSTFTASPSLAKCCSSSTIAMARSREACSTVKPSVVVSTTSPVVMRPARHSITDHASTPPVTTKTETAWNRRSRSMRAQALALRGHLVGDLAREPRLLALGGAEGAHQAHIAHDIGEIAAHRRGSCRRSAHADAGRRRPAGR